MTEPVVDMALGWAKEKKRAKRFEAALRDVLTVVGGEDAPWWLGALADRVQAALDEEGKDGDAGG